MGFVSGTKIYFHKDARKLRFCACGNIVAEAVFELN